MAKKREAPVHDPNMILRCKDGVGVTAKVSAFMSETGRNISYIKQGRVPHKDGGKELFMRLGWEEPGPKKIDPGQFDKDFSGIQQKFGMTMQYDLTPEEPKRVLLLATTAAHCVLDVLNSMREKRLNIEVPCVIANHRALEELVHAFRVQFEYLPMRSTEDVRNETDDAAYVEAINNWRPQFTGFARYMRIFTEDMIKAVQSVIWNVHHGFIPGGEGARTAKRMYDRGSKVCSAAGHIVIPKVDAGPIVYQAYTPIPDRVQPEDIAWISQIPEMEAFRMALRALIQNRVMVYSGRDTNGGETLKTIIFEEQSEENVAE